MADKVYRSRFFSIKIALESFNLEETKEAIKKPLKISKSKIIIEDNVIDEIYKKTLGHPFFVHFIMRELVSTIKEGVITLRFFKKNYPLIEKIIEREKFEVDFSVASEREKKILLAMANIDSGIFSPSEIKISNARTRLSNLVKKELIIKNERGKYSLYHPLFKEYLRSLK